MALGLLRNGFNTLAARYAKEAGAPSGAAPFLEVAERLFKDPGIRKRETEAALADADRALEFARRTGVQTLAFPDADYPPQLREIADPPPVLWVRGVVACLPAPAIGIVGSRGAVPASLAVARTLGKGLSEAGLVVVSGLAIGVDGAAHAGAVAGTGRTVAVKGCGLGVVYPQRHRGLAEEVGLKGALVSEFAPWSVPHKWHFPMRNRIISGLSRAVVIVEAGERSGSLITARLANEQGRTVLAVPGGTLSGRHRGSNGLIKDGARLVETVDDVLEEIGWRKRPAEAHGVATNPLPMNTLESRMAAGEPYSIEQLAALLGRPASETLVELSYLELAGRVVRMSGAQYVRIVNT